MKQIATLSALACLLVLGGCGAEKKTSSVVLGFSTDMSVPDDVKGVALFVSANGKVVFHEYSEAKSVDGKVVVQFPSTFAVYSYENARERLRLQLVAYGRDSTQTPWVVRDSITTVPSGRSVLLRMPLLWINQVPAKAKQTSGLRTQFTGGSLEENGCPADQSRYGGVCAPIEVIDPDTLPDYSDDLVFGGSGKSCFDVAACFGKSNSALAVSSDCTVSAQGVDLAKVSLALETTDKAGVDAGNGRRLIVLDKDSREGWQVKDGKAILSAGVCALVQTDKAKLFGTTDCEPKTETAGTCGPWNDASKPGITPPGGDDGGGTLPDASVDARDATLPDGDAKDGDIPDGPPTDGSFDGGPKDGSVTLDASGTFGAPETFGLVEDSLSDVAEFGTRVFGVRKNGDVISCLKSDALDQCNAMVWANPNAAGTMPRSGYRIKKVTMAAAPYFLVWAPAGNNSGGSSVGGSAWVLGPLPVPGASERYPVTLGGSGQVSMFGAALGGNIYMYGNDGTTSTGRWTIDFSTAPISSVNATFANMGTVQANLPGHLLSAGDSNSGTSASVYIGGGATANPSMNAAFIWQCNIFSASCGSPANVPSGNIGVIKVDGDEGLSTARSIFFTVVPPTADNAAMPGLYRIDATNFGAGAQAWVKAADMPGLSMVNSTIFDAAGANGIAWDTTNVYFTTSNGLVVAKDKASLGATPLPIAAGEALPLGIATDTQYVYWVNFNGGTSRFRRAKKL